MALTLYLGSEQIKENKGIVALNDIWFQNHIKEIRFGKEEREIVKEIDKVDYAKDGRFKSKFMEGTLIDSSELSTGCKTALNIYSFPDNIFNLAECGDNALQLIVNLKRGKAYIDYRFMTDDFTNTIEVVIDNKEYVIGSNYELDDLMEGYFNARNDY